MTKPYSPDVKLNSFKIRVSNSDLDVLHARAKTVNMSMTQYLRWRGMQPIGRINQTIKQAGEKKALIQSEIAAYIDISRELNRQGINLNQLTAAINSDKLESKSIEHHLDKIDEIRKISKEILESIQHLKASHDR